MPSKARIIAIALTSIALILLLWLVSSQSNKITTLTEERDKAQSALVAEQQSKENQIKVLEETAAKTKAANATLKSKLVKLEKDNEKVDCAMPTFMRDAFSGL